MQAHLLSMDSFGMPKVAGQIESMYTYIVYLILLEKGKFQTHPDMGVDIRRKYRFNNDTNLLQTIQKDISNQISTYLPELGVIEVAVNMKNQILGIIINTEAGAYAITYDTTNGIIDAPAVKLLENL